MLRLQNALGIVSALIVGGFYAIPQSWGPLLSVSSDVLFVLVAGICSIFGFILLRKMGVRGKLGMVNLGLFLASSSGS